MERSLLESGQLLTHHDSEECSGSCCLHGSSVYASCKLPRSWRPDLGIIEHVCIHGVGHPCHAALDYMKATRSCPDFSGMGVHGCCGRGCCGGLTPMTVAMTVDYQRVLGVAVGQQATETDSLAEQLDVAWKHIDRHEKMIERLLAVTAIETLAMVSVLLMVIFDK